MASTKNERFIPFKKFSKLRAYIQYFIQRDNVRHLYGHTFCSLATGIYYMIWIGTQRFWDMEIQYKNTIKYDMHGKSKDMLCRGKWKMGPVIIYYRRDVKMTYISPVTLTFDLDNWCWTLTSANKTLWGKVIPSVTLTLVLNPFQG